MIATNSGLPKWFAIGSRPSNVSDNFIQGSELMEISPNPSNSDCLITLLNQSYTILNISVADLQGNEMINLTDKLGELNGINMLNWNCTGKNGNNMPSGCYFVKALYKDATGQVKSEVQLLNIIR